MFFVCSGVDVAKVAINGQVYVPPPKEEQPAEEEVDEFKWMYDLVEDKGSKGTKNKEAPEDDSKDSRDPKKWKPEDKK